MRVKALLTVAVTLICALTLTIIPLPAWAEAWRPLWVALAVFYWILALPEHFGVGLAWCIGLLLDALTGSVLGAHALAMTLAAFVAARSHLVIRMYPVWQQSLLVALALALYEFALFWINGILGVQGIGAARWFPILSSAVLWPWVFVVLRAVRRRYVSMRV